MPVTPALRKLRSEDGCYFEACLAGITLSGVHSSTVGTVKQEAWAHPKRQM